MRLSSALQLSLVCVMAAVCPVLSQDYVWQKLAGPDGGRCFAIGVRPTSPCTVFVGTYRGVHRSTDCGQTWSQAGMPPDVIKCWAVDPENQLKIYAGGDYGKGVLKSLDGGATWTKYYTSSPQPLLYSLAIDPANPQIIYAGTQGKGAYRSDDGGEHWAEKNTGFVVPYLNIYSVAVKPDETNVVLAACCPGIYRSVNRGDSWSLVTPSWSAGCVYAMAFDSQNPGKVYAGTSSGRMFRSGDGGQTWEECSTGLQGWAIQALLADPSQAGRVYAATWGGGVFVTSNGGDNWSASNAGVGHLELQSLAASPGPAPTVFAGAEYAFYRSLDGGATWTMSNEGFFGLRCQGLALDASSPASIWLATSGGAYRSADWGATWNLIGRGDSYLYGIAVKPGDPSVICVAQDGSLMRTTDGGASWSVPTGASQNYYYYAVAASPSAPNVWYAAAGGLGVLRSTDGGATWQSASNGLTSTALTCLAIDPADPATVYAGTSDAGVFKTTNGGGQWQNVIEGMTNLFTWAIAVSPVNRQVVYVGTNGGGVFKSSNGGQNWSPVNTGLTEFQIDALACSPTDLDTAYAGGASRVFRTTDGGASWSALVGMPSTTILALAIHPSNPYFLYAGTDGLRVWRCSFRSDAATIAAAHAYPDGQLVRLAGKVVSAVFSGHFYIQETNRSMAIRVVSSAAVEEGDEVTLTGVLRTTSGEREIVASEVIASGE